MITIHAQLIDGEVREMGYIIYVFKNLEPSDPKEVYKLVTRWPNWNHRDLKLGEIGYLTYNDVESGRTEWYNPNTKTMELYRTTACEFISFIAEKKTDEQEYIMLNNKINIMGVLADKLSKALDEKNNVNSYIWKGPKKNVNGQTVQEEVKLVDATPEQLNQFYKHCMSMLYSKDDKDPGRHHLFEIVDEQKRKCNTELFIRWLENRYQRNIPKERPEYKRFLFLQDMLNLVDQPAYKERYGEDLYKINIDSVVSGYPAEFRDITVGDVRDGCLDALGVFDRSHLSLNFITKLGVWFTPQEKKDLEEKDEKTGKNRDRLDVIKERHNLKQNVKLKISQTGLSYSELRAMLNLKSKRYSELTTEQLITLRSKVLFRFQDEIRYHMRQWNERVKQIEEVADLRGIKLEKVEF